MTNSAEAPLWGDAELTLTIRPEPPNLPRRRGFRLFTFDGSSNPPDTPRRKAVLVTTLACLIEQLESSSRETRQRAAEALLMDPTQGKVCAARLAQAAADDDPAVRELITGVLEEMGPPAVDQVPALITAAASAPPDAAYWAVTLLGRLGPPAAPSVGTLAHVLETHESLAVRQRAAWALGCLGEAALGATEQLQAAAQSSDPRLARQARTALSRVRGLADETS